MTATQQINGLNYSLQPLSADADQQVAETVAIMTSYAVEDAQHPLILNRASALKRSIEAGQKIEDALFNEAQRAMAFVLDRSIVLGLGSPKLAKKDIVEVLVRPVDVELMRSGAPVQGDCDDFSMYVVSLALALKRLGLPVENPRFVTVAADHTTDDFSHVYARIDINGKPIAIDASHGEFAGWEVPRAMVKREREYSVEGLSGWWLVGVLALAWLAGAFGSLQRS